MPEGPEVKNVTDTLLRILLGKHVYSCDVIKPDDKLNNSNISTFKLWLPAKIVDVTCKGKLIYIHLLARNGVVVYLHSHLRMTGSWIPTMTKYSRFKLNICRLMNTSKIKIYVREFMLYFNDSRKFGVVEFMLHDRYIESMNKIGPDLLSGNVKCQEYKEQLEKSTRKKMFLYKFLLEQKYFSGIGNYLKSEIMYRSRLHPKRTLGSLTDYDKQFLFNNVIETIREAYLLKGLTIKDYIDPDGNYGRFVCEVYNRTHDPNGYEVIKEKMGQRGTYYVPQLQI